MMKSETINDQILPVLSSFWIKRQAGERLGRAFHDAVRDVAGAQFVKHQTILDGFTRRLGLNIDELRPLLGQWTEGDPKPLANKLKEYADPLAHNDINDFFERTSDSSTTMVLTGVDPSSEDPTETFSFDLPQSEARMLHTFAANDGASEVNLIRQMVRAGLAERMRAALQGLTR